MSAIKGKPVPSRQKVSDETLKLLIPELGVEETARKVGVDPRGIKARRRAIELREGIVIQAPERVGRTGTIIRGGHVQQLNQHPAVVSLGYRMGMC